MNSFELSRNWFNFCFDNPELIKPIHSAIFFFAIEHCNRLGGKEKFGFPSQMTMEAIGIKKHQTYSNALNEIANWGFITFIERSRNQYSANIITINAVPNKGKARGKALDKAMIKHSAKQGHSTVSSTVDIDKPINHITNKPKTNKPILMSEANASNVTEKNINYLELSKAYFNLFEANANSLDVDWVHLKKISAKKFIDPIRLMIEQDGRTAEDLIKVGEFLKVDDFWKQNIQSTTKLREKFDQLITKAKNGKQKGNSALKNALRNYKSNFDS